MSTPSANIPFPSSDRPDDNIGSSSAAPYGSASSSASSNGGLGTTSAPAPGGTGNPGSTGATIDRLVRGAHDTIDRVAEKAAPMLDDLKTRVGATQERLSQRADDWVRLEHEMAERARTHVRNRPLTAVALAMAAGMLIARITSSR